MKKSEVIRIISDYTWECYEKSNYIFDYFDSRELLEKLEQAGMLPPRTDLPKLGISDNAWEPEDE